MNTNTRFHISTTDCGGRLSHLPQPLQQLLRLSQSLWRLHPHRFMRINPGAPWDVRFQLYAHWFGCCDLISIVWVCLVVLFRYAGPGITICGVVWYATSHSQRMMVVLVWRNTGWGNDSIRLKVDFTYETANFWTRDILPRSRSHKLGSPLRCKIEATTKIDKRTLVQELVQTQQLQLTEFMFIYCQENNGRQTTTR